MLKKIGATENDVLSEKSQNENSSHWMHPPSVVNPRKGSQTLATATKPLDTDKHAPLTFQQVPRQRFGDSLLARLLNYQKVPSINLTLELFYRPRYGKYFGVLHITCTCF